MYLYLVPSTACSSSCAYCYGPRFSSPVMDPDLAVNAIRWAFRLNEQRRDRPGLLRVSFHGGEPLLAGPDFFRAVFRAWNRLALGDVRFEIQSNLWHLTEDLCRLFGQQQVNVGTSLDGPRDLCDAQRGSGYYDRTMGGLNLVRRYASEVTCITTITPRSLNRLEDILKFFIDIQQNCNVYGAVPGLSQSPCLADWTLTPQQYADAMLRLLDLYLPAVGQIRIESLDRCCRALRTRRHPTCLFSDCLGDNFAVDSHGWIYPCLRCVGDPAFRCGNIAQHPQPQDLVRSSVWDRWQRRRDRVREECSECTFWSICMGGCPANWEASAQSLSARDPYCVAYRALYGRLLDCATEEIASAANREKIGSDFAAVHGLLQAGPVLELISGQRHPPRDTAAYRRIVAAAALGTGRPTSEIAASLVALGVARNLQTAVASLQRLQDDLRKPRKPTNDCHVHVTDRCSVGCRHCFASSTASGTRHTIAVDRICQIIREASQLQFRRVVLSGGEPLEHPDRDELLRRLAEVKGCTGACFLVLRTALVSPVDAQLADLLSRAVDQVVVSLDGAREYHDARRFRGAYDLTMDNLRILLAHCGNLVVRLAALVDASPAGAEQAREVRALAETLGIESVVVRQPKPLGRALQWLDWEHQNYTAIPYPEAVARGMYPRASCAVGSDMHIESDLRVYPCFATVQQAYLLGSLENMGLAEFQRTDAFQALLRQTVDELESCRDCHWRYLCGGACRSWAHAAPEHRSVPRMFCDGRKTYAEGLLAYATAQLGIRISDYEQRLGFPKGEE